MLSVTPLKIQREPNGSEVSAFTGAENEPDHSRSGETRLKTSCLSSWSALIFSCCSGDGAVNSLETVNFTVGYLAAVTSSTRSNRTFSPLGATPSSLNGYLPGLVSRLTPAKANQFLPLE